MDQPGILHRILSTQRWHLGIRRITSWVQVGINTPLFGRPRTMHPRHPSSGVVTPGPEPSRRAQSLLKRKRLTAEADQPTGSQPVKSSLPGRGEAVHSLEGCTLSTVNSSTNRPGRLARVELSSAAGGFKRTRRSPPAVSRTQARVGLFAWVKKPSGICSGRVLHRSNLRGHRTKGTAVLASRRGAGARGGDESNVRGAGFTV